MTTALAASPDPGSWLVSHPQLIVVLFVGAMWLIKLINRARTAASGPESVPQEAGGLGTGGQGGPPGQDLDDEERTRRVREDILRKIAERRGGGAAAQPAPARGERQAPGPPALSRAALNIGRGPAEGNVGTKPRSTEAPVEPPVVALAGIVAGGSPGPTAGSQWLEDLRSRDAVRRAILAREILGPPVALR